jgi:hypothetical protein
LSNTVMLNEQDAVLPPASVALNVITLVVVDAPFGKAEPLAKPVVRETLTPAQLSVAVGVAKVCTEVHWLRSVLTVLLAGQLMLGGCTSLTVTKNEQVDELPLPSVARHVTTVLPRGKAEPLFRPLRRVSVGGGEQLSDAEIE